VWISICADLSRSSDRNHVGNARPSRQNLGSKLSVAAEKSAHGGTDSRDVCGAEGTIWVEAVEPHPIAQL
jgi:hypothetical protein